MNIKPLGDRLLVKRANPTQTTKGGIVLPDSAKEKPKEGSVISTGDGKLLESGQKGKLSVKKGDRILFTSYAGTEIQIDGKDYLIMNESDVLAVLN